MISVIIEPASNLRRTFKNVLLCRKECVIIDCETIIINSKHNCTPAVIGINVAARVVNHSPKNDNEEEKKYHFIQSTIDQHEMTSH